jgi:hypothetical protein
MLVERTVALTYPKSLIKQPLVYGLIHDFDLAVNIEQAEVSAQRGWLVATVRGEGEAVDRGLAWIAAQGVQVDILPASGGEESCES